MKTTQEFAAIISRLSDKVFIPIAAGGGIRSIEDAETLFNNGADKIVINSILLQDPDLVKELINRYGAQSIIASIDYKKINNVNEVYISDGSIKVESSLRDYIKYVENLDIGEIYLNSIDKDGTGFGYDFETINIIKDEIKVPLIIAGGAGNQYHLLEGLNIPQISAVATANLFNFIGQSLSMARKNIIKAGVNIACWE